jgi:hypothetical protein
MEGFGSGIQDKHPGSATLPSLFSIKLRALLQDSSWSLSRPHVEVVDWQDASRIDLDTVYDKFFLFSVNLRTLQDSSWSLSRPHVEVVDWQDSSRIDLNTVYDKFLFSGKLRALLQDSSWSLSRPHVEVVDWQDASRIDLDTVYDKFEQGAGGLNT